MKISLFIPCFIDQLSPSVGISVVRIFEKLGHKIEFDESIVCCGQPAFNTGCWNEARSIATRVVERLQSADVVVIPSGSCGAMIRVFYPEIFKDHPKYAAAQSLAQKTYELSEFLVDRLGVTDLGSKFPARVTFHDGCHGLRELRLKQQSRQLLQMPSDPTCSDRLRHRWRKYAADWSSIVRLLRHMDAAAIPKRSRPIDSTFGRRPVATKTRSGEI